MGKAWTKKEIEQLRTMRGRVPMRGELVALALVRDSGRTRATPGSGRQAVVWVAVEAKP